MMGRQRADQGQFFYSFHLQERVPASHLLRKINVFVSKALADVHREMAAFYIRKYRASQKDCQTCELKSRCCPNMQSRNVQRSVHEEARDHARQLAGTPQFERSRNERKKVEMLFAHLKTTMRFERMRLRGLTGARDEFLLAAIAQNLRRMARLAAAAPA
jgi:Transposase DDE domain